MVSFYFSVFVFFFICFSPFHFDAFFLVFFIFIFSPSSPSSSSSLASSYSFLVPSNFKTTPPVWNAPFLPHLVSSTGPCQDHARIPKGVGHRVKLRLERSASLFFLLRHLRLFSFSSPTLILRHFVTDFPPPPLFYFSYFHSVRSRARSGTHRFSTPPSCSNDANPITDAHPSIHHVHSHSHTDKHALLQ